MQTCAAVHRFDNRIDTSLSTHQEVSAVRGHGTQIIMVKIAAVSEQQVSAQTVSRRQFSALSERIGRQDHLLEPFPAQVPRYMQFHRRR